jgi:hypothetical protein
VPERPTRAAPTASGPAGEPEPEGLPAAGSWIRAVRLDAGGALPLEAWHCVRGWDREFGCLSTRCRSRATWPQRMGLERHLGLPLPAWWLGPRPALLLSPDLPRESVCGRCVRGLERDAARLAASPHGRQG